MRVSFYIRYEDLKKFAAGNSVAMMKCDDENVVGIDGQPGEFEFSQDGKNRPHVSPSRSRL